MSVFYSSSYQIAFPADNTLPSSSCTTILTSPNADGVYEVVVRFGDVLWDLVDAVCKLQSYDDICQTPVFVHVSSVFDAHPHARYGMTLASLMDDSVDKADISWHCVEGAGGVYLPDEDMVVFPSFNNFFQGVLKLVEEIARHSCCTSTHERSEAFHQFFNKACCVVDANDVCDLLGDFSIGGTRGC
jgi:hypothetical protein